MYHFLAVLLLATLAFSGEVRFDCMRFVEEGLARDPQLAESRYSTEEKKNKLASLTSEVILPTFYVSTMVGPAPGLKESVDNWGDTVDVYDFTRMGPFWGVEGKFIQPLNFGQYRSGKMALEADLQQKTMAVEQEIHKKDVELQSYYYNYLLAPRKRLTTTIRTFRRWTC